MLTQAQLSDLARAMTYRSNTVQAIDAGYTYFGQFIAHDIVAEAHPGGRATSGFLDLDSLYGEPGRTPSLLDERGMFRMPETVNGDVLRSAGVPQIPERRNDDNVIILQFHSLWQRFHNFLLATRCAADATAARRQVTLVFQLLVVEDFLRVVLAPVVFDSCFRAGRTWLRLPGPVPPEFSNATFRFGHSMVRPFYEAFQRDPSDVGLAELFRPGQSLDPALTIDWRTFFGWPVARNQVQDAMAIDPNITAEMARVPAPTRGPGVHVNIIEANLRAGQKAGLLAGREYVDRMLEAENSDELHATLGLAALKDLGPDLGRRLSPASGVHIGNLPLWPYILVEAAQTGGRHLGILGSMWCAEVLREAISRAPTSIYAGGRLMGVDEVTEGLGELGRRIRSVRRQVEPQILAARRANQNSTVPQRSFCMRHVIELMLDSRLSSP